MDWLLHPDRYRQETRGWRIRTSPDDADTSWLETAPDLPNSTTFLKGFTPGGANALVRDIVQSTY